MAYPFGSEGYSREELRAEISVLALGEQLGVGHNPERCASYVASWIKGPCDDPREIFRAASDAEKIVRFMRGLERSVEQAPEQQAAQYGVPSSIEVRAPVLIPGESESMRNDFERVYLAVPYAEKDEAKALGARFDGAAKCWYAPPGADLAAFKPWLPEHAETRNTGHDADPRQAFAQALREAGLEINGLPEMDGRLHRVRTAGDGRGEKSGWYVGHADGHPAGEMGDWRTGDKRLWKDHRPAPALGAGDRARLRAETAQRRQERERREAEVHEAAAWAVSARLAKAEPATADHPYLRRKGVGAHGAFLGEDGELLVPVRDLDGKLTSAQSIRPDGAKSFARGGRIAGGCHVLGDLARAETVLICEGYATGATLHETIGLPVAVAFNAGALEAVARAVRERWPDKRIIVAGDDDRHKEKNVGQEKAVAAAEAAGGFAIFPKFGVGESGTDWNDLSQAKGQGRGAEAGPGGSGLGRAPRPGARATGAAGSGGAAADRSARRGRLVKPGRIGRSTTGGIFFFVDNTSGRAAMKNMVWAVLALMGVVAVGCSETAAQPQRRHSASEAGRPSSRLHRPKRLQLVAKDLAGQSGEPIPLAITAPGGAQTSGAVLFIRNMPKQAILTTGFDLGGGRWIVLANRIKTTWLVVSIEPPSRRFVLEAVLLGRDLRSELTAPVEFTVTISDPEKTAAN